MEHCNSLPREAVESPSLEIIEKPTGPEQPALPCLSRGWAEQTPEVLTSLSHAGIPWCCRESTVLQVHWHEESPQISPLK